MDSIGDLLPRHIGDAQQRTLQLKEHIYSEYCIAAHVRYTPNLIVLTVPDSTAVMNLRTHQTHIREFCSIDKHVKIIFKINPTIQST